MIVEWWAEDLHTGDYRTFATESECAKFVRSDEGECYCYGYYHIDEHGYGQLVTLHGEYD